MASYKQKICDLKANVKPSILDIYVHKAMDQDTYLVGDQSGQILLSMSDALKHAKKISIGGFFRLIKPEYTGKVLKISKIGPLPIGPFNYATVTDPNLEVPIQSKGDFKVFSDYANLLPTASIPNIIAKVVHLSPEKKGRFSKYKIATVKDINGQRNFVTLFGIFADHVGKDKIYAFKNLTVQNYKGPHDLFNRLSTKTKSEIVEKTQKDVIGFFENITDGDGSFQALILGHERPYIYLSCIHCSKANFRQDNNVCSFCQKSYRDEEAINDFNVNLIIESDEGNEEPKKLFCFRRHLGIEIESNMESELQKKLEKLHFKKAQIVYIRDSNENLRALEVTILESLEDEFFDSTAFDI